MVCADVEHRLLAAARQIPNDTFEDSGSFTIEESPLVLFATYESSEDNIYPRLEIQIAAGRYRILTANMQQMREQLLFVNS